MKITRIESFARREQGLVRVTADDGSFGWGQVSSYNADIAATVLHRQVAPYVLGFDPLDTDKVSDEAIGRNGKFPGSYVNRALSGVDTALWDLRGRLEGKAVCELLGGEPKPIRAYGSSMSRRITPTDEAERMKRLRDEKGFTAFKMRVGQANGGDRDAWPGRSEELVPTVRKAVGDGVELLADGNSCYSPPKAIALGKLMQDNRFYWFEEPCPYWELEWTKQVTESLDMNVAGGEQDCDLKQWERIIGWGVVSIAQPDVCYMGGMTRTWRVVKLAEAAGLPCVPHSANNSLVTVFALHVLAAAPNAGPFLEFTIEDTAWTDGMFEPAMEVRDGHVAMTGAPGWGVEPCEKWLKDCRHEVTES